MYCHFLGSYLFGERQEVFFLDAVDHSTSDRSAMALLIRTVLYAASVPYLYAAHLSCLLHAGSKRILWFFLFDEVWLHCVETIGSWSTFNEFFVFEDGTETTMACFLFLFQSVWQELSLAQQRAALSARISDEQRCRISWLFFRSQSGFGWDAGRRELFFFLFPRRIAQHVCGCGCGCVILPHRVFVAQLVRLQHFVELSAGLVQVPRLVSNFFWCASCLGGSF